MMNSGVNLRDDMEGSKEAFEDFAREAIALYGRDALKLLRHRAEIANGIREDMASRRSHRCSDVIGEPGEARTVATAAIRGATPHRQPQPCATEEGRSAKVAVMIDVLRIVLLIVAMLAVTGCPGPNYAPYDNMTNSYG